MRTAALEPFGREITDFDLAMPGVPAEELAREISAARVVVFRNQSIDDAGLVRFLRSLGPLTFTDGETPVEHAPDLNVVSNLGRTTPPAERLSHRHELRPKSARIHGASARALTGSRRSDTF